MYIKKFKMTLYWEKIITCNKQHIVDNVIKLILIYNISSTYHEQCY